MTRLVTPASLHERRAIARGPLAALADGLRVELAPLIDHPVAVPREKALLSRTGGRCGMDGALLSFDPFDPRHRCPTCGREYHGELHDRFRLYWYQLWLAERAVHAALLGALTDDAAAGAFAAQLLDQYAEQYLRYPNADNVLGPSRPFFSTYLESIWLLQLMIALSILESTAFTETSSLGARVRDRVILPSAMLIASYDEGMSNRQVWNNAALMAAGRMLDDASMFERAIHGPSGLHAHLGTALLDDGSWYEGENYHLFAHRGLWYGVNLARVGGSVLPPELEARYREGFAAPFRTLLPDLTYPSRRDSQYAVSIRQPRFAESCELGLVHGDDERLTGMLARLYDSAVPRGDTGRRTSSADVERNLPATGLERTDLSWRTLLCARAELPPLVSLPWRSDLLPSQGIGVIRRSGGDVYVSLDYGHSGGGHGHPDRLNLTLMENGTRWFDDPGTGWYVDPSLHWYRSTLAHNAPLVDGRSQPRVHGTLVEFEDDGNHGVITARVALAPGLDISRTIIVLRDYLVDVMQWHSHDAHEIGLPMHGVEPNGERVSEPAVVLGADGTEDGFTFMEDVARVTMAASNRATLRGVSARGARLEGWACASGPASLWTATVPAPPNATGRRPITLLTQRSASGTFASVWSWGGRVTDVTFDGQSLAVMRSASRVEVHAWEPLMGAATSPSGDLPDAHRDFASTQPEPALHGPTDNAGSGARWLPSRFDLGARNYRQSELAWVDAGGPTATISVTREDVHSVWVTVEVHRSQRRFIHPSVANELDNEPASINGDSIQLYAATSRAQAGLLLVPDGPDVAMKSIDGWLNDLKVDATWSPASRGYQISVRLDLDADATELALDVLINVTAPDRARRQGQLVLSGANDEFVYLRGDRHEPSRLLRFTLT